MFKFLQKTTSCLVWCVVGFFLFLLVPFVIYPFTQLFGDIIDYLF